MQETDRFDENSGGVKIAIEWDRIIRPDGIAFYIKDSVTGDAEGRGGGALGYVDEQIIKKYALPLAGTVVTSATSFLMAANEDSTGEVETSKQQAAYDAREAFIGRMKDIISDIIEKKEQIQAVTFIPAGTRIIVYPRRDLWLRTTKEIATEIETGGYREVDKDVLIDDREGKPQQNVQSGQNNEQSLMDNNNNNNNNQQGAGRQRTLPPPSADGTGADYSFDNEENEGEIDLDFD